MAVLGLLALVVLLALFALFAVPLVLCGLVYLITVPIILVMVRLHARDERRFFQTMRAKGRAIDWDRLEPELAAGRGIFLIEQGFKGSVRLWWTEEDVASICPVEVPDPDDLDLMSYHRHQHVFVRWCFDEYLDPGRGRARLTKPDFPLAPGYLHSEFFNERYPAASAIDTVYCLESTDSPCPTDGPSPR